MWQSVDNDRQLYAIDHELQPLALHHDPIDQTEPNALNGDAYVLLGSPITVFGIDGKCVYLALNAMKPY